MILVDPYEVAQRNWNLRVLLRTEGIDSQLIFEASDDNCKGQRINTGLNNTRFISQWRQLTVFSLDTR